MGGACSAYGGRGEAYAGFGWGKMRERVHLGDPSRWEYNIKMAV